MANLAAAEAAVVTYLNILFLFLSIGWGASQGRCEGKCASCVLARTMVITNDFGRDGAPLASLRAQHKPLIKFSAACSLPQYNLAEFHSRICVQSL